MSEREKAERAIRNFLVAGHMSAPGARYETASARADDMLRAAIEPLEDKLARLTRELEEARTELAARESDMATAAGAFTVPLPEPGTDMARLLIANRLLRRELEEARKCCRWEASNQRRALEYWDGEYGTTLAEEFPFGCDTIEHVAEALIVARRELEEARERERTLREAHERSVGVFRRACDIATAAIMAGEPPEAGAKKLRAAIESEVAEINALVTSATPPEEASDAAT